jgi:DNA/RNA-binding domain of Phe-tRNA-synthetase-like protein
LGLVDDLSGDLSMEVSVEDHPLLELSAFVTVFRTTLEELASDAALVALLSADAASPFQCGDEDRQAVRDMLRRGGFKPTGRSKPASEYLRNTAGEGRLQSINLAVDAGNAVSLHSGLPISVVDWDLAQEPFRVAIAPEGAAFVFNQSGQSIDLKGLVCLYDASGPCANAVKDSQRTKTHPQTRRTLSVIWGTKHLPGRAAKAEAWYRELLHRHGATTETCAVEKLP